MPALYDELRTLAAHRLRGERRDHTLSPTALVHETYLKLRGRDDLTWEGRSHFLAIAARALRQVLVDHARVHDAQKRRPIGGRVDLEAADPVQADDGHDVMHVVQVIEALESIDERRGRVAELRLLAGMTLSEIAGVLEVSKDTVKRDWRFARAWIGARLGDDL